MIALQSLFEERQENDSEWWKSNSEWNPDLQNIHRFPLTLLELSDQPHLRLITLSR